MIHSQHVMIEIARQRQDALVREARNRHHSRVGTPAPASGGTVVARRSWFTRRPFAQATR
jgi:hypothetical protein